MNSNSNCNSNSNSNSNRNTVTFIESIWHNLLFFIGELVIIEKAYGHKLYRLTKHRIVHRSGSIMIDYIDIHSHILPNLDDGSNSIEQTINMLKVAYKEGIRTIIITPHYHEGRAINSLANIEDTLNLVKIKAADLNQKIDIKVGCEIYYSHSTVELLRKKQLPTMAGSRYVLIEFSHLAEYQFIKNAVQSLMLEGYSPILAHIERYGSILKDIDRVEELVEMGAYIQVNAMSVIGDSGMAVHGFVKKLLKHNLVHFIATDCHNDKSRAPKLAKSVGYIAKKYGEDYAIQLVHDNPLKILQNEYIDNE